MKLSPIAVVSMGSIYPGAENCQKLWNMILNKVDAITDVPPQYWNRDEYYHADITRQDKVNCVRGGFLPQVDFDPLPFGIPPKVLGATDVVQLLALLAAQKALDGAKAFQAKKIDHSRVGVILGVAGTTQLLVQLLNKNHHLTIKKAMLAAGVDETLATNACEMLFQSYVNWEENTFPGYLNNIVAGRIANRFNLKGTNCTVDAACASSAAAFSQALSELWLGKLDMVVSGGADASNDVTGFFSFGKTHALSPTGDCRPFAEDADGTLLGEGAGVLVFRRLEDAVRDGDTIYGVIRGIGSSSDGKIKSIYAPSAEGQSSAIKNAYANLDYGLDAIELLEAHGTGTVAGDRVEFEGILKAFGPTNRIQDCALGSIKSQIGHTKAASGTASLIKMMLALHHKVIPPTIKVQKVNPRLKIEESPYYLPFHARPWIHNRKSTRKAALNAFGFGGSNFHLTLEEYVGEGAHPPRIHHSPVEMFLVQGASLEELKANIDKLDRDISKGLWAHAARSSQESFVASSEHRLAIIAKDVSEWKMLVEKWVKQKVTIPGKLIYRSGAFTGKLAVLFPGQGSQYVDMGQDVAIENDLARSVWDHSADVDLNGDEPLHRKVFPPPALSEATKKLQMEVLSRTEWAQPAIGAMSASLWTLLRDLGLPVAFAAGHSYGEVTALYSAGVISSFDDFLQISRKRGLLMAEAASKASGGMTAISSDASTIELILKENNIDLTIANNNSPLQTVVSGSHAELDRCEQVLKTKKISAKRLPVSCAFHSPLVADSALPFKDYLKGLSLHAPQFAVYSNADAKTYSSDVESIQERLSSAIARPVYFQKMLEQMYAEGARVFLEVGPSSVLTRLVQDSLPGKDVVAVSMDRKGADGLISLWSALGELATLGIPLQYSRLWENTQTMEYPLAPTPSPVAIRIDGSLVQKMKALPDAPIKIQQSTLSSPVTSPMSMDPAQLRSLEHLQARAAEAQKAFERNLTESHLAFLKASEEAFRSMGAHVGAPMQISNAPQVARPSLPNIAPAPQALVVPVASVQSAPQASVDLRALLIEIVADKTGYPIEMIQMDTDLEAGLGIDSIKRVEIFAALQEKIPGSSGIEISRLTALKTLGEIVAEFQSLPAAQEDKPVVQQAPKSQEPIAKPASLDIQAKLIQVIADKTGYPVEMLDPGVELESGLGIDSIKRIEIFSELAQDVPLLSPNDMGALASLRTIADIVAGVEKLMQAPKVEQVNALPQENAVQRGVLCVKPALQQSADLSVLGSEPLYVICDDAALATAVQARLGALHVNHQVVSTLPVGAKGLLFIQTQTGDALAMAWKAYQEAKTLGQSLSKNPGLFIAVQNCGGSFGLNSIDSAVAWNAGLSGLAKSCAKEWANSRVKVVDLATQGVAVETIAERIAQELLLQGDVEVAIDANGARSTIGVDLLASSIAETPMTRKGCIVVSGGARGIAVDCLIALAERQPMNLALLGRTALWTEASETRALISEADLKKYFFTQGQISNPAELKKKVDAILANREIEETLQILTAKGCTVEYCSVDICDSAKVTEVIQSLRQKYGAVQGVIHSAGVLADALIADKTQQQFERVFQTKVQGLQNLLQATSGDALELLCCFSSVAARFGNRGQTDYAMANEILNKVCQAEALKRAGKCRVLSLNWGPWDGGMVTPFLKKQFEAAGVFVIPVQKGAQVFAHEILVNGNQPCEIVVVGERNESV